MVVAREIAEFLVRALSLMRLRRKSWYLTGSNWRMRAEQLLIELIEGKGRQDRSGAKVTGRGGEVGRMTEEASPTEKPRMKNIPCDVEPYFIAFLFKGERWNDTQGADVADLVPRQLAFIREQVQARRYLLAGPITDDGPLVGISIIAAGNAARRWRSPALILGYRRDD